MKFRFAAPAATEATAGEAPITTGRAPNLWTPMRRAKLKIAGYREHLEAIRADPEKGEQAAMEAMRQICRKDLFYLAYEILGYRDMFELLHDDMCEFFVTAEIENKDSLALIPRSHFKSTIGTIARCIWWMIRDQDTSIGLGSGTLKSAKKFLREIRNHLERNKVLLALFPDIFYADPQRESPKWTTEELMIKRRYSVAKEPTLKAFGIEENLPTGDHYRNMVIDDVVDQEVVSTEVQMAKIQSQLRFLRPLRLTTDQPIHWVGTRYHVRDPYAKMIEDVEVMVYLRRAVEHGNPIFPTRFSAKSLERERVALGTFHYNSQYMMDPQDATQMRLNRAWLKRHSYIGPGAPGYAFFAVVDPASRQKKESDFTAITVWALDWQGNYFLVDGVHDKLNPAQRIRAVFELQKKWKIPLVGYETIGFQETDAFWIRQTQQKKNQHFKIFEIKNHTQAKDDRILGLQPLLEAGKFSIPEGVIRYKREWEDPDDGRGLEVDIVELLLEQYEHWPYLKFDDLLDSMQMLIRTAKAPAAPKATKPEPQRSAYRRRKPTSNYKFEEN